MWNKYDANFDAPDAHFDELSLFSDARAEKVQIREKKNVKTVKEPLKTKTESHKIEPNPSKDRAMHERAREYKFIIFTWRLQALLRGLFVKFVDRLKFQ
jgi:hypothetical protein